MGVAHLETFGSQKVIAKEKGTLVDNLSDGGVAILNADDELVRKMGEKRSNIERILVGLNSGDIRGNSINYNYEGTNFQLSIDEEKTSIQTRLLGSHNVQNMLLAIGTAHHFGIRAKTIALGAWNQKNPATSLLLMMLLILILSEQRMPSKFWHNFHPEVG